MRRYLLSLIVFALCILIRVPARTQGLHLGIKAGSNMSELTGKTFSDGLKGNFMAGAFAQINFTPTWGIQPEILFGQTTSQTSSNFSDYYEVGIDNHEVKLSYMSIPVLITYKLPIPILSLQLGPEFGTLLNNNTSITSSGEKAFKSGNFSMDIGAQINLLMFTGGVRYSYGFSNINNLTVGDTWKTRTVQLYLGFRLF